MTDLIILDGPQNSGKSDLIATVPGRPLIYRSAVNSLCDEKTSLENIITYELLEFGLFHQHGIFINFLGSYIARRLLDKTLDRKNTHDELVKCENLIHNLSLDVYWVFTHPNLAQTQTFLSTHPELTPEDRENEIIAHVEARNMIQDILGSNLRIRFYNCYNVTSEPKRLYDLIADEND